MRQTSVIATSLTLLPLLNNNEVAYGMAKDMVSSLIRQGYISKEDLKIVYNNWDKCRVIMLELDKLNK